MLGLLVPISLLWKRIWMSSLWIVISIFAARQVLLKNLM